MKKGNKIFKQVLNFYHKPAVTFSVKIETLEKIITGIVFLIVYGLIFYLLDLRLIFLNSTISGGDTGSHVYIPYYLKQIFPLIRWWSPDWYSGFPFLYFYPPLVYLLTVILSFVIPLNISFKILISLCFLIYPIAFYLVFSKLNFKFPTPQLAAVFSLFMIFLEKYSIYGGNLPSLLAGQFSHTLSIPLLFLTIAFIASGIGKNKYLVLNIVLGTFVILSHPISGIILIFSFPFLLTLSRRKEIKKNFLYLFKIAFGIFLLSSFWTLPLVFYQPYAGIMNWTRQINFDQLFPAHWTILVVSAGLGIILALIKREKKLIPFFAIFSLSLFLYFYLNNSGVWNTRFLPYLNLGILFFAAYFLGFVLNKVWLKNWLIFIVIFVTVVIGSLILVRQNSTYSSFWFKWNFEGYQKKPGWVNLDNFFKNLKDLPKGRVLWEYNGEYDKYGTPRVLEALTVFSGQSTFEGLLIESSLFGPFHFINQAETSMTPTAAVAGFSYPPFNFRRGIEHMKLSGVRHYVPYTEKLKQEAILYPQNLSKIRDLSGGFQIYELKNSSVVDPIEDFSVEMKDKDWLKKSIEWYKNSNLKTPIVFTKDEREKEKLEKQKLSLNVGSKARDVKTGKDFLEFKTDSVGSPYVVKITYFPTWKVSGAEGPYLISPSYMMIIPTQEKVKLDFSYGLIDWFGLGLTFFGIIYLIFIKKINNLWKIFQ